MTDIDLNINNYSVKDLENFFQLKTYKKYSISDIEYKEYEIRQILLSSGHIDKRFKSDLIHFLDKAKQIIIHNRFNVSTIEPSTLPYNFKLDKYNYPFSPDSRELLHLKRVENGVSLYNTPKNSVVSFIHSITNNDK
jgi:hypothetical protein